MAKFLDPRQAQILGGALAGGALMEDEQEVTSTAMGLAIGGFTGSMLDLDFKNIDNIKKKRNFKLKADAPEKEVDILRQSMLDEIADKRSKLTAGDSEVYKHLTSDPSVEYNSKDVFNTITNDNLEAVIADSDDLNELKKIRTAVQNDTSKVNSFDPKKIDLPYKSNLSYRVAANESYDVKVDKLTEFFKEQGYVGDSLDKKIAIFSNLIDDKTPLVMSKNHQALQIGEKSFKISSFNGEGAISSFLDTNNYWAVQKVNPFAAMYMKGEKGEAIATAIGLKFSDAANADLIKESLEDGAKMGMKPEDLKAVLMSNPDMNEEAIDKYLEKAYQHQELESGARVRGGAGSTREALEANATDIARRTSAQTLVGDVFMTDPKTDLVDPERMLRPMGTVATDNTGAELNKYIEKIVSDLDLNSSKHNVKGDSSDVINLYGTNKQTNLVADAARNSSTTGSRTNKVDINSNSQSPTTRAFERMVNSGNLPDEFATSIATARMTVDEGKFNKAMSAVSDVVTLTVADGASIAQRKGFTDYSHSMFNKEIINEGRDGKFILSEKIEQHIEQSTKGKFPSFNLPKIEALSDLEKQTSIVEKSRADVAEMKAILADRQANNTNVPHAAPSKTKRVNPKDAPSTKVTPERIENLRDIRRVAPNTVRNPESIAKTKEVPRSITETEKRGRKVSKRQAEANYKQSKALKEEAKRTGSKVQGVELPLPNPTMPLAEATTSTAKISAIDTITSGSIKDTLEDFGKVNVENILNKIPDAEIKEGLTEVLDLPMKNIGQGAYAETTISEAIRQSIVNAEEASANPNLKVGELTDTLLESTRKADELIQSMADKPMSEVLETRLNIPFSDVLDQIESPQTRGFVENLGTQSFSEFNETLGQLSLKNIVPEVAAAVESAGIKEIPSTSETPAKVVKSLEQESNQTLLKKIAAANKSEKDASQKIIDSVESAKTQVAEILTSGTDVKTAQSLSNLTEGLGQGNVDEFISDAIAYNKQANFEIKPGEYLGSNANGSEVKVSNKLSQYTLVDANFVSGDGSRSGLELIFEGKRTVGEEGAYIKLFGDGAKENNVWASATNFERAMSVASLEAKGYDYKVQDGDVLFKPAVLSGEPEPEFLDKLASNSLLEDELKLVKNTDISVISSGDGVGLKLAENINTGFAGGTLPEVLEKSGMTEFVQKNLMQVAERENAALAAAGITTAPERRSVGWALGMLGSALTEGKAASGAVMGLQILGDRNIEHLLDSVDGLQSLTSDMHASEQTAIRTRGEAALTTLEDIFGKSISEVDPDDFRGEVRKRFDIQMKETADAFKVGGVKTILENRTVDGELLGPEIYDKKHVDMFKLAYGNSNESIMVGSPDISPTYNYGSGSIGKTMSYNAQIQLRMNGFSADDLSLFGGHDSKAVYDINMITASSKPMAREKTLNHFFTETGKDADYITNFMDTVRSTAPENLNDFLEKENVFKSVRDNDFLYYTVQNGNEEKFQTLAIPKHDTNRVGFYDTDAGHTVKKSLGVQIIDTAQKDLNLSLGIGNSAKQEFADASKLLKRSIIETVGSQNNPAMKDLFALQAPNSSYSVILPASGDTFNNLVKESMTDTTSPHFGDSFIGITEAKAQEILELQGIDVPDINEYLNEKRILQTELTDGTTRDLMGLENREPTYSANSARVVKYRVMTDAELGETVTKDAVFHSAEDKHYSKLMFGDYDLDHALVYNFKEKVTPQQYQSFADSHNAVRGDRDKLLRLGDSLGIKSSTEVKDLYSLDVAVERVEKNWGKYTTADGKPMVRGSQDFYNAVIREQEERLQEASLKAGKRKIITPKITQLNLHLGESIEQITKLGAMEVNAFDKQAMKTMSHFLVENLIKNQHAETNVDQKITTVEELINAKTQFVTSRSKTSEKEYSRLLTREFTNLLKNADTDVQEAYQPHIRALVASEIQFAKNPKFSPTSVVDVAKNVQGMMDNDISHTVNVIEGIAEGTGLIEKEDLGSVNVERTLKNGYNEASNIVTDNFKRNAIPLAIGAGLLATGALMTQKDPDFGGSKRPVRGDIGSMMLAPSVESQKQSKQIPENLSTPARSKTGYITPSLSYTDIEKTLKQTARVTGSYNDLDQDMQHSMKRAIFGDNVSSVRIDKTYDY